MKIALASDWFIPRRGGIELQQRDLAIQLRDRGHEVEAITPFPGDARIDGMTVHRLAVPRLPGAGVVFTPGAVRGIRDTLRDNRYDVVHVHFGIVAPAAYAAAAEARRLGLPVVATFHSVLDRFGVPLRLVRRALHVATWPVVWSGVSSTVNATLRPLVGRAEVEVLPNGIDAGWWRRPRHPDPDGVLRVVSAIRLHPRKRPLLLVDAVARMRRALRPGQRLEVKIFGDGRERGRLAAALRREGLHEIAALMGWRSREEVRAALHGAHLFMLPSRLEAFGIAALEARAAGVPVLAMCASGVRDFLTDGVDAALAASDEEFCDIAAALAANPATLDALTDGCRTGPAGLDWPTVLDRHEHLYAKAIRRG